jgi:hypothetical protein
LRSDPEYEYSNFSPNYGRFLKRDTLQTGRPLYVGPKPVAKHGVHKPMMKKSIVIVFAAGVLLLPGCSKPSSSNLTDWGVVELSAKTPKHLSLDGKDCTLTATPLADGKLSVFIETQIGADGKNPPGVRPGTPSRLTLHAIFPADVEIVSSMGHKLVRFTLKLNKT